MRSMHSESVSPGVMVRSTNPPSILGSQTCVSNELGTQNQKETFVQNTNHIPQLTGCYFSWCLCQTFLLFCSIVSSTSADVLHCKSKGFDGYVSILLSLLLSSWSILLKTKQIEEGKYMTNTCAAFCST